MNDTGQQPVCIDRVIEMPLKSKTPASSEVGAVTFAVGGASIAPQSLKTRLGKGSARRILFIPTRIIEMLIVRALLREIRRHLYVIQPVGGIREGVVFHGDPCNADTVQSIECKHAGLSGADRKSTRLNSSHVRISYA